MFNFAFPVTDHFWTDEPNTWRHRCILSVWNRVLSRCSEYFPKLHKYFWIKEEIVFPLQITLWCFIIMSCCSPPLKLQGHYCKLPFLVLLLCLLLLMGVSSAWHMCFSPELLLLQKCQIVLIYFLFKHRVVSCN